jgi:hypothetical protein
MKLYSEYPGASMEMKFDPVLHSLLVERIKQEKIATVIETGTYLGLGSTTNTAKAFLEAGVDPDSILFYTFEANTENYQKALENLKAYPFVKPIHGATIEKELVDWFITRDSALINPDQYNDIYIDGAGDTRPGYIAESLGTPELALDQWLGEGLLAKYLVEVQHLNPLILLDSAGGLGWAEFEITINIMQYNRYTLLLDDVHHVKHFRSLEYAKKHPNWTILGEQNGWALMSYDP